MKNLYYNLLIVVLILIGISGCQPLTRSTVSTKSIEQKSELDESMIDFETKGQGIALRYPEDWSISFFDEMSIVNIFLPKADTSAGTVDIAARIVFFVMPYNESDQGKIQPIGIESTFGGMTSIVKGFLGNLDIVENIKPVSEIENFTFVDLPATRVLYSATGVSSGKDMHIEGISFVMSDRLGVIVTVTEADQIAIFQPVYNAIFDSLHITRDSPPKFPSDIYLVEKYLASNDPSNDLEKAQKIAKAQQKSILLFVGHEMCTNCRMLDYFIRDNPEIAESLKKQFTIVKVNHNNENQNEDFLSQFPLIERYPHFFILNQKGELLDSMDTRSLELGGYYDRGKFSKFLQKWTTNTQKQNPFSIDYDPKRDPYTDLESAITLAQSQHKRILLEVGGDWCIWCSILDRFFDTHPEVDEMLNEHYVVVKVNMSDENDNLDFLSQFPEIPGYPHLFVLENDGSFLHSQGTGELEQGRGYDVEKIMQFLKEWSSR